MARTLTSFMQVSLDGYFVDAKGDMSWAHRQSDEESSAFAAENASGDGALLFGRKTYEMMASFWPSEAARAMAPVVAKAMIAKPKLVVSRTLKDEGLWSGTRLLRGDLVEAIRVLKEEAGPDIVILGSGSIVAQLSAAKLIDSYQLVINPLLLGAGRSMFEGLREPLGLKRTNTRTFQNGNVALTYSKA